MIPKSSRFKCERCGYLKKRPGKCVWCRKVADFDNLMGGGAEADTHRLVLGKQVWNPANMERLGNIQKAGVATGPPIIPISPDKPGADGLQVRPAIAM